MRLFLVVCLLAFCLPAMSQVGLFSPLAKQYRPAPRNQFAHVTTALPDSTFTGFRAVASVVVQAYPGAFTLAGVGFSYEHDTYNTSTQNMYTNWSIAGLVYAGGSIAPSTPGAVVGLGPNLSLFNKRVSIGGAYLFTPASNGSHFVVTLGTSLSFIN